MNVSKIILYGGSFDPIHQGHLKIADYAKKFIASDCFIWVPTNTNPFKKGTKISSSKDRVKMLELAIPSEDEISDFEVKRQTISYTKDTIAYFKSKYPNDELYFLIGSDLLSKLHKWEGIDWISANVKILVAKRTKTFSKMNAKKYRALIMDNPILEFSSTDVKYGRYDLVPEEVKKYYAANYLYLDSNIKKNLTIHRSKHCFATAELAGEYAKLNGIDFKKAYYAGMIHDITKEWRDEQHLRLLKKYYPNQHFEKHQYHQHSASLWFKHVYKNDDEEIFQALANHTTMEIKPLSVLDKIIYVADKLAYGRKWEGIQSVRKLALDNLELGFKALLEKNLEFLKEKGALTDKVRENYMEMING
ncbi:nicotinate (nicotinamide) nucleotide adenylyltransferase [Mycoplasmopsis agassizii]|uniref:Probable nicotinate-nucleotide adenylyltransferase n=1 Tax=Mycoplasmopsis agassizii TaxID=33922 RepID=A0A269TIX7_9BACT|nr:nicotinate-nucleotide adenylyltransferase [Mycoplasmopsis agassizii]PAK21443.1 nicotinate (nicotinamide) nucleotide adenylyltransferase [Mycoplasmopsis agassizii]